MKAELMHTSNADGIRLDGAFFDAVGVPSKDAVDALLLVHGPGGRFCQPLLLHLAQELREHGYPSLSLNTLGHDSLWMLEDGSGAQGNAFEDLDRSRFDLRAGIDWLEARGFSRIGLLGRSVGAVKAVYYVALEQDPRVAAMIAASPVRLSYSYFMASESAQEFRQVYDAFQTLVKEGRADELAHVPFPINNMYAASTYLDHHGPAERYNLLRWAHRIACPVLCLSGSREVHPRLTGFACQLVEAMINSPAARWEEVEGAEHSFAGKFQEVAHHVLDWLSSPPGGRT